MSETIFLTGATRFLGMEIVKELVSKTDAILYGLIRAKDEETAISRLKHAYYFDKSLYSEINKRIVQ